MARNPYRDGADIIVIKIENCTGQRIMQFRCSLQDKDEYIRILNMLSEKYGLDIIIKSNKQVKDWFEADEEFKW